MLQDEPQPASHTLLWDGIPGRVTAMAWQPCLADMLACGCQTGHIMLVSPATGQLILTTIKHAAPVQRLDWISGMQAAVDHAHKHEWLLVQSADAVRLCLS